MKSTTERIAETLMLSALAVLVLCAACWAGPPPPPVIATAPSTPVGGTEITALTAAAIAGYGFWKSRR